VTTSTTQIESRASRFCTQRNTAASVDKGRCVGGNSSSSAVAAMEAAGLCVSLLAVAARRAQSSLVGRSGDMTVNVSTQV